MAYSNNPVKIPEVQGKISFMKKTDRTYVRYEFGRTYNPARKTTVPQRVIIGLQIRNAPTLMLTNENFEKYFSEDGREKMTAKERKTAEAWKAERLFDGDGAAHVRVSRFFVKRGKEERFR